jgi:hypothetical protein
MYETKHSYSQKHSCSVSPQLFIIYEQNNTETVINQTWKYLSYYKL